VFRPSAQLRSTLQRTMPPLLIVLSAALIVLGKADQTMFESFRVSLGDRVAPALDALSRPFTAAAGVVDQVRGVFSMYQDNLRLTQENERLLQWQQIALKLSTDNQELRTLLKAVPDKAVSYVTARVIANSGGRYVRTVMINAGSEQRLARGQAAVASAGLVGRLTEVGSRAARVLLITDLNSRIPVVVERTRTNAVLAGDNSERPHLLYANDPDTLKIGDRVITSGEGGVFPPGLPVGVVAATGDGGILVEPYVELSQLSYVVIVDYGLSGTLPPPVAMPARTSRKQAAEAGETGGR